MIYYTSLESQINDVLVKISRDHVPKYGDWKNGCQLLWNMLFDQRQYCEEVWKMSLESKHINLLRSCAGYLRGRSGTVIVKQMRWSDMFKAYAADLEEIADELSKLNLPKTVVKLEDLFNK